MADETTYSLLLDLGSSTQSVSALKTEAAEVEVPCLTVLGHPDVRRIGECARLNDLKAGLETCVSRAEPLFNQPGQSRRNPLGDPHLSRRPIRFRPWSEGGIEIAKAGSKTALRVDSRLVSEEHRISAEQIERGVVLVLSESVVLLLHFCRQIIARPPRFGLVGESSPMIQVRRQIQLIAEKDCSVLVLGETGTGKELVAAAVHQSSPRTGRFVDVNMGALAPTLAAAELFGAAKGAFTGADRKRDGHFVRADRGTLFLDEIGEASPEVQALLLRALETGTVRAIGAGSAQEVDVRVIAATDADLDTALSAPLRHRLGAYEIHLPPLRARREDLGRLLVHFLRQELEAAGRPELLRKRPWLPASQVARMASYSWRGNVRQLRNVARQIALESRDVLSLPAKIFEMLDESVVFPEGPGSAPDKSAIQSVEADQEIETKPPQPKPAYRHPSEVSEEELLAVLREHAFRLQPTAAALRISRTSLYNLIKRSDRIRKARDLSKEEITVAYAKHAGDLDAAAGELEVSRKGLRRRMTELGMS